MAGKKAPARRATAKKAPARKAPANKPPAKKSTGVAHSAITGRIVTMATARRHPNTTFVVPRKKK
ncbi:hypothetical protein [Patulibacter sp.]|uniref:hypothetical protein n=1 Tax=Patulibacter sp. TaxID=1912859 RepID=UPI00271E3AD9|nr:hypothetical protein [Patulibacter sp.]MDO9409697.1 hypothetical protein [Patulibacter sp.]